MRLVLQDIQEIPKEERITSHFIHESSRTLFLVKPVLLELPENGSNFSVLPCENCGEVVAEICGAHGKWEKLCFLDCYHYYDRFSVN